MRIKLVDIFKAGLKVLLKVGCSDGERDVQDSDKFLFSGSGKSIIFDRLHRRGAPTG